MVLDFALVGAMDYSKWDKMIVSDSEEEDKAQSANAGARTSTGGGTAAAT